MKKTLAMLLMFLLFICRSFASDSYRIFFPSLQSDSIYPIEKSIGQTAPANQTDEHKLLAKVLSEPYSFEWCETYLTESSRKSITTLYSSLLSELLPAANVMFSKAYSNSDNSVSITVKFMDSDEIFTFVILEKYIIGMTSSKK